MTVVTARPAVVEDLSAIVSVHRGAFPDFFLTSLGSGFLRTFYRGLVDVDSGVLLVAVGGGGRILGFVGGSEDRRAFYHTLIRRRGWRFAIAALPAVVRHPSMLRRVVRGRRRASEHEPIPGSLMSLAVAPDSRSLGVGERLVSAFERELRLRGCSAYALTTDASDNEAVNAFYSRLGLVRSRVLVTPEGRRLNEYARIWSDEEAAR
ncbi:GNAT family N-acetyltransferase [Mumia zhuanghuii]|uniref:GNAT family N-acetyltransferase n=2 Tax=Mumia TaxID=1546255 RepID=A0ABW1QH89_9ACTN|nr:MULTISPECIES: GNAT family N-acetyltransferase [Mumia]KAA1425344.1 GNAT family N-acetyltransferase [Mumia zhuanghuii]